MIFFAFSRLEIVLHADTQLTITSTKIIQINFCIKILETFFHQLYAEGIGFRFKKIFELHFLILHIFLSFSPSAAVNFLSKIIFKKKLDFFPSKWAMVESGAKEIGGDI